jgi:membrane-bound acyltransferase YfiQ involved in biofilm formation
LNALLRRIVGYTFLILLKLLTLGYFYKFFNFEKIEEFDSKWFLLFLLVQMQGYTHG